MIWSWFETSLNTLHLGPAQTVLLPGRSRYHTTPQRVRLTTSSTLSISLRTSFAQIRRILPSNTFAVLAVCYTKHRIDQRDSSTPWYVTARLTANYRTGQRDSSYPKRFYGLFICYTSYQIGQTDFHCNVVIRDYGPHRGRKLYMAPPPPRYHAMHPDKRYHSSAIIHPLSFTCYHSPAIVYLLSLSAILYQQYEYNDNLSERSPVIIKTQLLFTVWWRPYGCRRWQPDGRVVIWIKYLPRSRMWTANK